MRRVVVVILFLLSTINGAHAEGVFKPYLVESTQDPVCQLVLKHYTDLFFSKAQRTKKTIRSPEVTYLTFDSREVEGIKGNIRTASMKIDGRIKTLVYHERWFGWRGEIYTGYLIDPEELTPLISEIKAPNGDLKEIQPYYPMGSLQYGHDFSWWWNPPFEYRGRWYVLTDFRDFYRHKGLRSLYRLKDDGGSEKVCTVKIFRNIYEDEPGKRFPFFIAYKAVVEEIMLATHGGGTSHPEAAARARGEFSASMALFRPWAAKTVWDDGEYTVLQKKHFHEWQYQDIWSYREYGAWENAKEGAVAELKAHYIASYAFTEKRAEKQARAVVDTLPGEYYSLGTYGDYSKDFSFLKGWVEGTYTNWGRIHQDMKRPYKRTLPLVTFSLMVDDPEQLTNLPDTIVKDDIQAFYQKDLLMYAAHMNNLDSVKYLVGAGWPLDRVTHVERDYRHRPMARTNRSALTYAAENASMALIRYLVEAGADTGIKDSKGNSLDFYIRKNPRFSDEEKALGFQGLMKRYADAGAIRPSFSCDGKLNRVERAICENEGLSIYDQELAALYNKARTCLTGNDELKRSQIRWIKQRNNYCAQFKEEHQLNAAVARTTRARIRYLEYLVALFEKENEVE